MTENTHSLRFQYSKGIFTLILSHLQGWVANNKRITNTHNTSFMNRTNNHGKWKRVEIALDHAHASIMNGLHICLMNTIMTPTIQLNQRHKSSQPPSFPITLSNFIVYKPPVFLAERWDEYIWCVKSHCLRRSDL